VSAASATAFGAVRSETVLAEKKNVLLPKIFAKDGKDKIAN